MPKSELVEILQKDGLVAPEAMDRALRQVQQNGESFAGWLMQQELLSEDALFGLLTSRLNLPTLDEDRLRQLVVPPQLRGRISPELSRSCLAVPLQIDSTQRRLTMAMCDPTDARVLDRLRRAAGVEHITAFATRRSTVLRAIEDTEREAGRGVAGEVITGPGHRAVGPAAGHWPGAVDDDGPTGVELIPGKVSVDPSLAREMSGMQPRPTPPAPHSPPPPTSNLPPPQSVDTAPAVDLVDIGPHQPTLKMKVPWGSGEVPDPDEVQVSPAAQDLTPRTQRTPEVTPLIAPLPARPVTSGQDPSRRAAEMDALIWELLSSVGVLVSLLEERVDPGAATSREFARLSRQIGRELGMDQLSVARIALAGHLYALDIALRREVGSMVRADVASVFEAAPGTPGGLGPTLRMLGARALGLSDRRDSEAAGITVLRVVADYLDLRERSGPEAEPDQIGKALLQSGADPKVVAALTGAIRRTEGVGLRTERTTEKPATGR